VRKGRTKSPNAQPRSQGAPGKANTKPYSAESMPDADKKFAADNGIDPVTYAAWRKQGKSPTEIKAAWDRYKAAQAAQ
jgi:hypothetical protein